MAKFGTLAAGLLAVSTTIGAAEQANAQASEILLPHPDGQIAVDVTRVALDTQMEILTKLGDCLQEGHDFADEDGNGKIEGDEVFDFRDEGAYCVDIAELEFQKADAEDRVDVARAGQLEAKAGQAAAQADIEAITDGLMEGMRSEGG